MKLRHFFFTSLVLFSTSSVFAEEKNRIVEKDVENRPVRIENVRTTAYTHSEADHIKYGRKTALGTTLRYSKEYTSAAADWSHLPVGTKFRIDGIDKTFVIDDYGSALVGRNTVDLYYPSRKGMNGWGLRHIDLEILEFGCYEKSREILEGRKGWRHCRAMLASIDKIPQLPPSGAPVMIERQPLMAEPEPEVMLANVEPDTAKPEPAKVAEPEILLANTEVEEPVYFGPIDVGPMEFQEPDAPEKPADDTPIFEEASEPILVASAGPVRRMFRPLTPAEESSYAKEVEQGNAEPAMIISPAAMATTNFQKRSFVPITPQS